MEKLPFQLNTRKKTKLPDKNPVSEPCVCVRLEKEMKLGIGRNIKIIHFIFKLKSRIISNSKYALHFRKKKKEIRILGMYEQTNKIGII